MPGARRPGTVYLVGAGPGDPDLITVRGRDLLSRAEVVIYDALAPEALVRAAPPRAERLHVGKRPGGGADQARINRLMIDRARRGRRVVRLKGGDPGLFGRGGEEMEALARAGVPFEVVPGVTAALGAAAAAGIPLTHRRLASSVVLATGHEDPRKRGGSLDWRTLAGADTLVLYMAVSGLDRIARRLLEAGRAASTPAAMVRWATRADQRIVQGTLGTIARRANTVGLRPPALLIAGEVVRLRQRPGRGDRRPLRGRTIVVTRAREQAGVLAQALRDRGARVIEAPAIAFAPPRSWAPLDRALRRLGRYRHVIFTSANGVARFFERLAQIGRDVRDLRGAEVIAIGPATAAALRERGILASAVPEEFRAEGIVAILARRRLAGEEVLIPRAAVARDLLVKELRRRGARVDAVPAYRTVPSREGVEEVSAALRERSIDLLTFTSSSTVEHFARKFRGDGRLLRAVPAAAIGPITARTARRLGFRVAVMPRDSTVPALAQAIARRFRNSPSGTPRAS
jgi:uroporphyrinogen III methyltransferase/synthase